MSGMRTDVAVMEEAARRVESVDAEVQAELSALRTRVGAMDGAWLGASKVAFDELMVRWNDDARRLHESLRAIGDNIRANGAAYGRSQEDHVQRIRAAAGPLNI